MIQRPPICEILEKNCLPTCASFVAQHADIIDHDQFLDQLCSGDHFVHIPLYCIFYDLNIAKDDISAFETEELLKAINRFKVEKQLPDWLLGQILDHLLSCHLRLRMFTSINDLTCLFSLLLSNDSERILESLDQEPRLFWLKAFNIWITALGGDWVSPLVVELFRSGDILPLASLFGSARSQNVKEFIYDLMQVQESQYYLSSEDWQKILSRRYDQDTGTLDIVLAAVLARCFLNWLTQLDPSAYDTDLPLSLASVVIALVEERKWRFADVSKLFRFSKKIEDLPGLLAALTQMHEANLKSTALDNLPASIPLETIGEMLENDLEFEPEAEFSRPEVIERITNSTFAQYCHESAPVSESELNRMISAFDDAYNGGDGEFVNEAKAVHAVEDFFKIKLRDVQIFGVLIATQARKSSVSRLLQMQTGEGKTFVIAALAIAEALNGNKVDIITSSETLAVTQSAELQELFASVGVSVKHNCDHNRKEKETSKIYEADVVYGCASHFMFDVLYEEFYGSEIRCKRGFSLAIIDEVDSQMLDHANHVCRFASNASGMGNLYGIQATIWMLVSSNFRDMKRDENGALTIETENGTVAIPNDTKILKDYFKEGLTETLNKAAGLVPGVDEKEKVDIPEMLREYTEHGLPFWLSSAVQAIMMRLDFDYCIEDDSIVSVDSSSSGSRNRGMRWSHGLHQFLEMLHGTYLRPENLTMCYLSTMSFCRRYGSNIIGLTGTIGGEASRKFLRDVYSVDFVEIPPFMVWRHISLPHVVCSGTEEWLQTVVKKVVEKLEQGRACLVITQYIHFAEVLCKEISQRAFGSVGTYTGADTDLHIGDKLLPGTCIVATNIAGRGTDFKISNAVEEAGGLHVVLTSLPENDRVERQNIGRSSRTGQRGTSQMILNCDQIDNYFLEEIYRRCGEGAGHNNYVETLKEVRDEVVLRNVDTWIEQMGGIQKADEALTEFINIRNKTVENFKQDEKSTIQRYVKNGLNIRFGLYQSTRGNLDSSAIQEDFGDLEDVSMENLELCFRDYVNPVFACWQLDWNPIEKPDEFGIVQRLLDRAIKLDPKFAGAAYYIRAFTFLVLYHKLEKKEFILEAIEDFKECQSVLQRLIEQYQLLSLATKKKDEAKTKLETQNERMLTICGVITGNIDVLIGRNIEQELKKGYAFLAEMKIQGSDTSEMEASLKELEDNRAELEKGVLKEIYDSESELTVTDYRLVDMLPESINKDEYAHEIDSFEMEGYIRLVSVKKREKINWWNVIAVGLLGLLQIVGGGLLAVFTGGVAASIGVGLMISGAFDIYTAIKSGIIDRDFDWNAYGLDKLLDLVTTVVTAGVSGLKAAAKGISQGAKTMMKIGTSQIAKQALKHGAKQAVKAVAITAGKVAMTEVLNATVAGPIQEAVSDILATEIEKEIRNLLQNNQNLYKIVDIDNTNNNRANSAIFVERSYDDFVKRVSSEFLDLLRKNIGAGVNGNLAQKGHRAAAKIVKTGMNVWTVAVVVKQVIENLQKLPEIAEEVANNATGHNGTDKYEHRIYEKKSKATVDDVIKDLSRRIARFCATKAVAKTQDFFSTKISNLVADKTFKRSDRQLENFKQAFVHSHDVAQRAKLSKPGEDVNGGKVLDHIAHVAENLDHPGDRLQAKYLSEAVQSSIEIEYEGEDGKKRIITYGKEFNKNPPIRLRYEKSNGPIGHYMFADGTHAAPSGKHTCLFDTVAEVTKYNSKDLKKASANFMLNDLQSVKQQYLISEDADLLLGGVRTRGPPVSSSAKKHVEICDMVSDVLRKDANTQANRPTPVPQNTIVDDDKTNFDNKADAAFTSWWRACNPKPTGIGRRPPQYTYVHDEKNIYEVVHSPGKTTQQDIYAYRGKAAFKVEHRNGAVHYDKNNSSMTSQQAYHIWTKGDPTNVPLKNIFPDHK